MGNLYKRPEDYDLKHLRYTEDVDFCEPSADKPRNLQPTKTL